MATHIKNFDEKVNILIAQFQEKNSANEKYFLLIDLGKNLASFPEEHRIQENLVKGCQSNLYISAEMQNGKIFFHADSDALISKGLAALLIQVYSGEDPLLIVKSIPHFLEKLGLSASLSPNRAQGIFYIFLKMQTFAKKFLL